MLPSWINQEGFPIVHIEKKGGRWELSQKRYLIDGETTDQLWMVPLKIRDLNSNEEVVIDFNERNISINQEDIEFPLVNSGGWGFYYSSYSKDHLNKIAENLELLSVNEKYRLIEDSWASVRIGNLDLETFMRIVSNYKEEVDVDWWTLISGYISTIEKVIEENNKENFYKWVEKLVEYNYNNLGFEPRDSETQEIRQLRSTIVRIKALYSGDKQIVKRASGLFKNKEMEKIEDGNYFGLILSLATQDEEISANEFLDRFKNSPSPQIESRYRGILGQIKNKEMVEVLTSAILDGTIRGADSPYIIASMLGNKHNGKSSWDTIAKKFDQVLEKMPDWTASRILDALPTIYEEDFAKKIINFLDNNPLPAAEKAQAQKIERLKANITFSNRISSSLENNTLFKEK